MFEKEPLKKFSQWFNLDYYFRFTPLFWDEKYQIFILAKSKTHQVQYGLSVIALFLKTSYLIYQLITLYLANETGKFVFHIFFTGPSALAVILDLSWIMQKDDYALAFEKMSTFCTIHAKIYKEKNIIIMPELAPLITTCEVPLIVIPICTAILHWEIPNMPQFLFSGMMHTFATTSESITHFAFGIPFFVLCLFEGFVMYKAWYNCITFALVWSAMTGTISFWLEQIRNFDLKSSQANLEEGQTEIFSTKIPEEYRQLYRQLQILGTLFNNAHANMLFFHRAAAFATQTAGNYGSLKLRSEMPFMAWICCPVLAISGTHNLFQSQAALGSVHEACSAVLQTWLANMGKIGGERAYMKLWMKSAKAIRIKHGQFSHFDRFSGVVFFELVLDYTINFLVM